MKPEPKCCGNCGWWKRHMRGVSYGFCGVFSKGLMPALLRSKTVREHEGEKCPCHKALEKEKP
jgi:hypothetical protein